MIRPLRRRHYRLAIFLALIVPVLLAAALAVRRTPPREPIPAVLRSAP